MPARDRQLIERMLQYCGEIEATLEYFGRSESRFNSDFIMRNALGMPLQQIGELATHLSADFIDAHKEVQWKAIKGMRTWFAHQYWNMSFSVIWVSLIEDIPTLKEHCKRILRSL